MLETRLDLLVCCYNAKISVIESEKKGIRKMKMIKSRQT